MSSFTDLIVKALPNGKDWELYKSVTYDIGELGGKDKVVIPKGFVTDFGSVPKLLHGLVSPQGKAKAAFVLHDWLYHEQQRSRLVCDSIMLEALEVCGVNWFQRWLIHRGVRLGGSSAFNQHKKRKEKEKKKYRT